MSEIFSGFIGFYRFSRSRVLNIIEQKKKKNCTGLSRMGSKIIDFLAEKIFRLV